MTVNYMFLHIIHKIIKHYLSQDMKKYMVKKDRLKFFSRIIILTLFDVFYLR